MPSIRNSILLKTKRLIKDLFASFGYEIRRRDTGQLDVFAMQRELVEANQPVIFDVGAYVGKMARQYRSMFPGSRIYCFEPFPESCEHLRRLASDDPRTHVFQVAVSDKPGKAVLHSNTFAPTNSLLATDEASSLYWDGGLYETVQELEVPTVSIDAFCRDHGIEAIDILKLDVQGAEFLVLAGARDMLTRQAIAVIYSEIILTPMYRGQHPLHDYLGFLASFGYELFDVYHPQRKRKRLVQADFLFLSSKCKERWSG